MNDPLAKFKFVTELNKTTDPLAKFKTSNSLIDKNGSNNDWRNYVYGVKEGSQRRIQFDKEVKDSIDKYQAFEQQQEQQRLANNAKIQANAVKVQTPQPVQDNGFWAKVRNLNLEDTPLFKAIAAPINKLYQIPFTQRLITTAGETVAGPGAYKNNDGSVMRPMDTGSKVANLAADVVGTGLGFGTKVPGLNKSFQGAASNVVTPILSKLPQGTSKVAQYGVNALKNGLEFGALNTTQGLAQNNSVGDSLNRGLEGVAQGALFGTATKVIGDLGKLVLKGKNINVKTNDALPQYGFNEGTGIKYSDGISPLVKPTIPFLEPSKTQGNVNILNAKFKPIGNNLEGKLKTATSNIKQPNILKVPINGQDLGKSRFVTNSVQNSSIAPKFMKDTIEAPPYIKVHNQGTWNNALKTVEDSPQNALKNFVDSKELRSADETALGQALIVKAIKEGRISDANELSVDLAEKLSRAGQTVQAASIFKRLTPEGMLQYANNVVNRVNQVIEKETGLKDSMKKVKLSDEEANKILEGMKEYQKMPDGEGKNIKFAQIMQIINDKQPSSLVDKIRAARNISLLGTAKTNVRNVFGNTIMGIGDNLANTVGTPIDKLVALKTGQRSVAMPSLGIQAKGFAKGTKNAIQDSFGGIKLSDLKGKTITEKAKILSDAFANPIDRNLATNGKFETGNRLAFKNKGMRIAENTVGTALKVGDNSFKQAYKDDVLNQLMKANKVDVPTDEMKQIADIIANERTYQDTNSVSQIFNGIKNSPQKISNPVVRNGLQIFVDSQLPYVKTPANILKRAIEYTPIGIGEGGAILRKGLKNNTLDMALQRKAVDRLSRGIVGTGIMGLGALGAKAGLLTGAASKDKDMAAFDQQNGKQPYAIKLGNNKYYNYDWAQPMSIPLSAGVQMEQGKKGQIGNNALNAASNALNFYAEQPMLTNIQKLVGSQNGKDFGQRVMEAGLQSVNQIVPNIFKQTTQMTDNNVRSNYSPNLFEKTVINPIKSKIPGLSSTLPVKYDTLGNEVKQFQGNNNLFNVALNPGNLTTKKNDNVTQLVESIYNLSGDTIQVPRVAGNTITYTDSKTKKPTTIDLTGKEVQDLQKYIGYNTEYEYNQIYKKYGLPVTQESAQDRAKQLQSILTKIYNDGKAKVLENRGLQEYKK